MLTTLKELQSLLLRVGLLDLFKKKFGEDGIGTICRNWYVSGNKQDDNVSADSINRDLLLLSRLCYWQQADKGPGKTSISCGKLV